MYHKKQNLHFYLSNTECQQYWQSEQICLELKAWTPSFLNIRSSCLKVSSKKGVLKIKIFSKFIENISKLQANVCNVIEKRLRHISFLYKADRLLLLKYILKIKIAAPDKYSEVAARRSFLPLLIFNWRTFLRQVTTVWWR